MKLTFYQKGWLFVAWTFFLLFTSPFWFFRPVELWGWPAALIGSAIWLAHGAASVWLFTCPICGCSIFASGKGPFAIYAPWPRRRCAECGHDHRQLA